MSLVRYLGLAAATLIGSVALSAVVVGLAGGFHSDSLEVKIRSADVFCVGGKANGVVVVKAGKNTGFREPTVLAIPEVRTASGITTYPAIPADVTQVYADVTPIGNYSFEFQFPVDKPGDFWVKADVIGFNKQTEKKMRQTGSGVPVTAYDFDAKYVHVTKCQ